MGCLLKPIIGIIKWILMIIGLITLIVAIIIGVAFWQLTKTPALEGEMHEVFHTSADAAAFDREVQDLEDWLLNPATPVGASTTLEITEAMATAKIAEAIKDADIPVDVSDVWLNFAVDKEGNEVVQLLGKVDVGIAKLTAGLEMEIYADANGDPKITLSEVAIGSGFGIPGQAKKLIANAIPSEKALTDMIKDLPIDVSDIRIQGGKLIFEGTKKPAYS